MVNFFSVTSGKLIECHKAVFGKLIHCHGGKQSKCQLVNFFIDIHTLKKYYKFCIQYTMKNPDKTRFYLRHQLFRPIELRDEIQERIQATTEGKLKLYGKYLEESIARGEIVSTKEDAFRQYTSFIDNITFNMIFSGWKPSDEEIDKAWNLFYNNYLKE